MSDLPNDLLEWGDRQAFFANNIISKNKDSKDEHNWVDDLDFLDKNNNLKKETTIKKLK